MAEPRFFLNLGGMRSGPHTVAEVEARVRDGSVRADSWVLRDGDPKWSPVGSHPELHAALSERYPDAVPQPTAGPPPSPTTDAPAPAADTAPPPEAAPAEAGPARAPSLPREAGYKPGVPGPGLFLAFHERADVLARRTGAGWDARARDLAARRTARRIAATVLLAGMGGAVAADRAAGDGSWVFSKVMATVAVLGWLGAWALTHPAPRGALGWKATPKGLGCLLLVAAAAVGIGLMGSSLGDDERLGFGAVAVVLGGVVVVAFASPLALPADDAPSRRRFEAALDALRIVEDEMPPRKAATGWIDLGGAELPNKKFAAGRSASGREVELYRDEWFRASGLLRDGSHLRLSAVERRRVKKDRYRTSRSGRRRRRPGSRASTHALAMKLRAAGGGIASVTVPCGDPFTARDVAVGFAALREAVRARPGGRTAPGAARPAGGA